MYKILNINGEDYKLEYTMEASLYGDAAEEIVHYLEKMAEVAAEVDTKDIVPEQLEKVLRDKLEMHIKNFSDLPRRVLTLFYAGLLEHHGAEGDGRVMSKKAAKKLLSDYFREHKDEETGNFYGMMNLIITQMGEDGFFELAGLNNMFKTADKKNPKQPQDHKKKITKVSEKES